MKSIAVISHRRLIPHLMQLYKTGITLPDMEIRKTPPTITYFDTTIRFIAIETLPCGIRGYGIDEAILVNCDLDLESRQALEPTVYARKGTIRNVTI